MLSSVFSTKYWQSFSNSSSNHERVCSTETILVRLSKSELFKVQSELANIGLLFNGYLTGISSVFSSWIRRVDEDGLVLVGDASTSELE